MKTISQLIIIVFFSVTISGCEALYSVAVISDTLLHGVSYCRNHAWTNSCYSYSNNYNYGYGYNYSNNWNTSYYQGWNNNQYCYSGCRNSHNHRHEPRRTIKRNYTVYSDYQRPVITYSRQKTNHKSINNSHPQYVYIDGAQTNGCEYYQCSTDSPAGERKLLHQIDN